MATWDQLFKDRRHILLFPQHEAVKFIQRLEATFRTRPLAIWDICCGGGRHTILAAQMGHRAYATDISPTGIAHLTKWTAESGIACSAAVADMTANPWGADTRFHGIVCWDALHHNTLTNIHRAVSMMKDSLLPGGLLLASLVSTKSGGHGKGREIEPDTFVSEDDLDAGVPHHYFSQEEVAALFRGWRSRILAESVVSYIETEPEFYKQNPFPYTKWYILMSKEE